MAGELITKPGQYEFRDLLLGSETPYVVEEVTGLFDLPAMDAEDEDRQDQHGFFPGVLLSAGRTIDISFRAMGNNPDETFEMLELLMSTFKQTRDEEPLVYERPGWGKRRVYGRVYRRAFPSNYELAHGLLDGAVQLKCADPRHYSNDEEEHVWTIADGSSSAQRTMYNDGHEETVPYIALGGPFTDPIIQNQTNGNLQVKLDIQTSTNDVLIVDFKRRTVIRNNTDVTGSVIRPDSRWWELLPGGNTIQISRSNTVGTGEVNFRYRHAWM